MVERCGLKSWKTISTSFDFRDAIAFFTLSQLGIPYTLAVILSDAPLLCVAQQFVDAGFRTCFCINTLDDHRAVQAVLATSAGQ